MKSKSPILDGAMQRMKADHCLPTATKRPTVTPKSYTLTMSVWHGSSYKDDENATGDSIENALAEQFHDVCRCLSEFGTAQYGWADYAMTGEPYTDDPSVTAFDAAHGDKITTSPQAANVQPLKPELDDKPKAHAQQQGPRSHRPGLPARKALDRAMEIK